MNAIKSIVFVVVFALAAGTAGSLRAAHEENISAIGVAKEEAYKIIDRLLV